MLRPVVLKDPVDLLHAAAQPHVSHQDDDLDETLNERKPNAGAQQRLQQGRKPGGDKDKQHRRQGHPQHHGHTAQYLHQVIAQLFLQPLIKFGGLLLHAGLFGALHQAAVAHHHRIHHIEDAPQKGHPAGPVRLLPPLVGVPGFHIYAAVRQPGGHARQERSPHHNALNQGLSAYGSFLLFVCHMGMFISFLSPLPAAG